MAAHCNLIARVRPLAATLHGVGSDGRELRADWRHAPATGRMVANAAQHAEIIRRHDDALELSLPTYPDPVSMLSVFTADFLARRGYCCDSGCRHCPYLQE